MVSKVHKHPVFMGTLHQDKSALQRTAQFFLHFHLATKVLMLLIA